jgi:hypothetical protein
MGEPSVTELLGARFSFQNPFLFYTKAMICQELVEAGCVDLAFDSISCDRLHREEPMQCGYCSSCLLRRQALAVHGVEDRTPYIATTRLIASQLPLLPKHAYLLAMLRQVEDLRAILSTRLPWQSFVHKSPRLADIVDQTAPYTGIAPEVMRERLLRLYQTYVYEWDSVRDRFEAGLLLGHAKIQVTA